MRIIPLWEGDAPAKPVLIQRLHTKHNNQTGTHQILEVAILDVKPDLVPDFPDAFAKVEPIFASIPGYISQQLKVYIEIPNRYILLVNCETLEAHTINFRQSPNT